MFGDRELTEPITVSPPYCTKAIGSVGELLGATEILYEMAPEYLVHLRITALDVAENTDTWKSDERDEWSGDHYTGGRLSVRDVDINSRTYGKGEHTVPDWVAACKYERENIINSS